MNLWNVRRRRRKNHKVYSFTRLDPRQKFNHRRTKSFKLLVTFWVKKNGFKVQFGQKSEQLCLWAKRRWHKSVSTASSPLHLPKSQHCWLQDAANIHIWKDTMTKTKTQKKTNKKYWLQDAAFTSETRETRQHCLQQEMTNFWRWCLFTFSTGNFFVKMWSQFYRVRNNKESLILLHKTNTRQFMRSRHIISCFTLCKCLLNLGLSPSSFWKLKDFNFLPLNGIWIVWCCVRTFTVLPLRLYLLSLIIFFGATLASVFTFLNGNSLLLWQGPTRLVNIRPPVTVDICKDKDRDKKEDKEEGTN